MPCFSNPKNPKDNSPIHLKVMICLRQTAPNAIGGTTGLILLLPLSLPNPHFRPIVYVRVIAAGWGPIEQLAHITFSCAHNFFTILKRMNLLFCLQLERFLQKGNFQVHRWDSLRRHGTLHRLTPIHNACPRGGAVRTRVGQQGQARQRRRRSHPQWAIEAHASARHATTTSQRKDHPKGGIENAPSPPRGRSPGKPCAHDGRAQQTPARMDLQVGVCCVIHRYVRLTRGPCSSEEVECSYSDWARISITNRSQWFSLKGKGALRLPRELTLKTTEDPRLMLKITFGSP